MQYREQLNIILMRDKGPRRSYHMRVSHFVALLVFFGCLPVLCGLLTWQCAELWDQNQILRANMERFETDCQLARTKAERLAHLESLLDETALPAREMILRRLAASESGAGEEAPREETAPEIMEGPGHEEFAALDTDRVKIGNVRVRAMRGNTLQLGLDLRNPEPDKLLAGEIFATLLTADGKKYPLGFQPAEAGTFRINRFKRATMIARLGQRLNLANAQVLLEVKEAGGDTPIYRNVFQVQR